MKPDAPEPLNFTVVISPFGHATGIIATPVLAEGYRQRLGTSWLVDLPFRVERGLDERLRPLVEALAAAIVRNVASDRKGGAK